MNVTKKKIIESQKNHLDKGLSESNDMELDSNNENEHSTCTCAWTGPY